VKSEFPCELEFSRIPATNETAADCTILVTVRIPRNRQPTCILCDVKEFRKHSGRSTARINQTLFFWVPVLRRCPSRDREKTIPITVIVQTVSRDGHRAILFISPFQFSFVRRPLALSSPAANRYAHCCHSRASRSDAFPCTERAS
jgi:hypothetical protein